MHRLRTWSQPWLGRSIGSWVTRSQPTTSHCSRSGAARPRTARRRSRRRRCPRPRRRVARAGRASCACRRSRRSRSPRRRTGVRRGPAPGSRSVGPSWSGRVESDRCVLAMQMGRLRWPSDSMRSRVLSTACPEVDAVGAVDARGDGLDLLGQGHLVGIEEAEVRRAAAPSRSAGLRHRPDRPGEVLRARAARRRSAWPRPQSRRAGRQGDLAHGGHLGGGVGREGVDGHDDRDAVEAHVLDLLGQVLRAAPRPPPGPPSRAPGRAACRPRCVPTPPCILSARMVATIDGRCGPDARPGGT